MRYLWIAATADELELPIYVTDSSTKLAKKLGIRATSVISLASRGCNGRIKGIKFFKVEDLEE